MPFLAKQHVPVPTKDILSWTFDDLSYDWDKPIYIDATNPDRHYTARTARTLIRQLAAGFRAIGVQPGDCCCIHSFNDILYPLFFLGLIAADGVFAGTNPAYTAHELAHTLKTARVKFILTQPQFLKNVLEATKKNGIPQERIIIFNPQGETAPDGFLQWKDLLRHGERDWVRFDSYEASYNAGAARLFSSGTTGLPKAAELTHYNLIAQHTLVLEADPRPYESRRLVALPLFHAAMAPGAFCAPLRMGEAMYIFPRFDLEAWLSAHEKYGITDLAAVPPIVVAAVNSPLIEKYSLKSVQTGQCGAAPLDKGMQARMRKFMAPGAPFTQVWGMTETSCVCTKHGWDAQDSTGSIGRPIPNVDVKLVDDDGEDVTAYGVRGELCVRGPTIIRGYFENAEANARDWDDEGYFHTGDICFVEEKSGLYYIVDRKKELIKVRGFQVAPPELEAVLLAHPGIVDCGVIGVPDPVREGGELPRAYIVRRTPTAGEKGAAERLSGEKAEGSPTESEIHALVTTSLASYKRLEGGIVFVESIPKNASGKILKKELRERAKGEMLEEKRARGAKL
jgi:acyl-CoA synthetase (AMP-forming)/AMP-acid ligase II